MSDKAILDGAEQVATMLAVNRLRSAAREAANAKALLVAVSVPDLQAVLAELAEVRRLKRTTAEDVPSGVAPPPST
jgi:hypothetical protein